MRTPPSSDGHLPNPQDHFSPESSWKRVGSVARGREAGWVRTAWRWRRGRSRSRGWPAPPPCTAAALTPPQQTPHPPSAARQDRDRKNGHVRAPGGREESGRGLACGPVRGRGRVPPGSAQRQRRQRLVATPTLTLPAPIRLPLLEWAAALGVPMVVVGAWEQREQWGLGLRTPRHQANCAARSVPFSPS